MALFKKSPITSRKARKEAIQEVRTWANIWEVQIGACLDTYKFGQFVDKQKKEHLQSIRLALNVINLLPYHLLGGLVGENSFNLSSRHNENSISFSS